MTTPLPYTDIFGFGTAYSGNSGGYVSNEANETTPSGKLIERLKFIANQNVDQATSAAGVLASAANSGQNLSGSGLVYRQMVVPTPITANTIFAHGWSNPTLPALPALPAIPTGLNLDYKDITGAVDADVAKLQASWMAKFLPQDADVSSLNNLFKDVLGGGTEINITNALTNLATTTTSALSTILGNAQGVLNNAINTMQFNLAARFTTANSNVASALAIAGDNTQNIAWARARDQVAREAARKGRESISQFASRGFNLPPGALIKRINQDQQDTLSAASDIASEQAVKTQQLFFDTAKMSVDTYMKLLETQATTDMASFNAVAAMNIRNAELSLDANKFNAKLAFDNLGLRIDFTKFAASQAIQYRLGVLNSVDALVNSYAALVRSESEYFANITSAKRLAYQAMMDYYRAAIQYGEYALKAEVTNSEMDIRFTQTAAQFIGQAVGNHVQAASSALNGYAQIAGMALSGLNAIAATTDNTNH